MVCGMYPLHFDINISLTFRLTLPQLIVVIRHVLPSQIPHFGLQRQNNPEVSKRGFQAFFPNVLDSHYYFVAAVPLTFATVPSLALITFRQVRGRADKFCLHLNRK